MLWETSGSCLCLSLCLSFLKFSELRWRALSVVLMYLKAEKELRKVKVVGGGWVYDHNSS